MIAVCTGTLSSTAALGYAASQGLMGAQLLDPRPDAQAVVIVRAVGHSLLVLALLSATLRALRLHDAAGSKRA